MFTATADATGTAVITVQAVPAGLMWLVSQMGISTVPFRVGAACTVKRGLEFIANSGLASADTASGQPAIQLTATDVLTATFTGLTKGDEALVTLFVEEIDWQNNPTPRWVV